MSKHGNNKGKKPPTLNPLAGQSYHEVLSDGVLLRPLNHLEETVASHQVTVPSVVANTSVLSPHKGGKS